MFMLTFMHTMHCNQCVQSYGDNYINAAMMKIPEQMYMRPLFRACLPKSLVPEINTTEMLSTACHEEFCSQED